MLIGAMNHPAYDPVEEVNWMAEAGLEFVDLTLEPPGAAPWRIEPDVLRRTIEGAGLGVVGHTAYYLPIGHPFEEVRDAATSALVKCLGLFAEIGAQWMNVHPNSHAPMHNRAFVIAQNLKSLATLVEAGKKLGIGVMVENVPEGFNTPEQLAELLDSMPDLGLHLDVGHANLRVSSHSTEPILARYADRLRHVHVHDNNGHGDLHLPLGAGNIEFPQIVRALRHSGYDGTITLEVFSSDRHYFKYSCDVLRKMWDEGS